MDRWIDGWMDRRTDGWMDRWKIDGLAGLTDRQILIDGQMNGWMDLCIEEGKKPQDAKNPGAKKKKMSKWYLETNGTISRVD